MAEAPANPGSSEATNQGSSEAATELEVASTPESDSVDESGADSEAAASNLPSSSSTAPSKAKKSPIETALSAPALGGIMNADSRSLVFVLDQNYTAVGDNGLIVSFTFNPTSEAVFSGVEGQVQIDDLKFAFNPVNPLLISGKNGQGEQVFIFVGEIGQITDPTGKNWSQTDLGKSKVKIEVLMEANGTTVKSINLALISR
jgi:hypothetical protein